MRKQRIIAILAALMHFQAMAQSLVGTNLRLKPSAIPTVCNTGDLRIDSGDSNKLKVCRSNTWTQFVDFATFGNADTVLASNGTTASWTKVNNANVSDTAAITYAKLNLTASVTNADVAPAAGIVYSKLSLASSVLGSDISTATSVTVASVRANAASSFGGNVTASGNFVGNLVGNVTGSVTGNVTGNADTATALAANPSDCSANQFANTIAANGNLSCAQPNFTDLAGTASIGQGGTNNGTLAVTAGGVLYTNGTRVMNVGAGTTSQVLISNGSSAPSWTTPVKTVAGVFGYNAGTPTTVSLVGGTWTNGIGDNGTGDMSITVAAGVFATSLACTCTVENASTGNPRTCKVYTASITAIRVIANNGASDADEIRHVVCAGN